MAILLEDVIRSLELFLRLTKKPQPYVDPDLDPVLLVPGIAGSILNAVDDLNGKEERVWVRILAADYIFRNKLWSRFDPSTGKTVSLDEKTRITVPQDRHGLYAIDVLDPDLVVGREFVYYFHDMIFEMIKWGFEEGKTLFGFGYDFRQSNRLQEILDQLATKLESIYNAAGGKKINIISHSMGGLLVKCFMCLHSDIFEKYVKNWIAIAAPFQGAPGYVNSTFLNGMSFVEGWEQNFFISKWSMHQLPVIWITKMSITQYEETVRQQKDHNTLQIMLEMLLIWKEQKLIECPSIYELMGHPDFNWQHIPLLELWREKHDSDGKSRMILESYPLKESIEIFKEALANNKVNHDGEDLPLPFNMEILQWANETRRILSSAKVPSQVKFYNIYATSLETPHSVCYGSEENPVSDLQQLCYLQAKYVCVDGDGTVPTESAKADGLNAEARVGVPGEHRGILCDHQVFRILKHWLKAGDPDPFYNPLNDYVILPTAFEMEKYKEKGLQVTSLKEEWEIISNDQDEQSNTTDEMSLISLSVSEETADKSFYSKANATTVVHCSN